LASIYIKALSDVRGWPSLELCGVPFAFQNDGQELMGHKYKALGKQNVSLDMQGIFMPVFGLKV